MTTHSSAAHVEPGGPSHLTTVAGAQIRKASVGPMDNNAYLITCMQTGAQLLVDAAADPDRLLALVREGSGSARLDTIVTTHQHADHHGALEDLVAVTGAGTAAGADDADAMPVPVRTRLLGGETITVGALELGVIALRGHTPGSVALVLREPDGTTTGTASTGRAHLFVGDCLFPGGVGNTFGNAEDFVQLLDDVEARIFDAFDDSAVVYPGHGDNTTLGAERGQLAEWRARGW